jgi:hypothetical protein
LTVEVAMDRIGRFLAANAIVGMLFGAVLVAAPSLLFRIYAIPGGIGAELFARLVGAELLGLNVPTWLARASPGEGRAFAVLGHAISEPLGFAVTLGAAVAHVGNVMVWGVVLIYGGFAAGNIYLLATKQVRLA